MKNRIPKDDTQPERVSIKEVIKNRGNVNRATSHNIKLLIDRTKRNLPNIKDI
jgi:hypothetical protein